MLEIQTPHGTILLDDEDAPLIEGARLLVRVDTRARLIPYLTAAIWKSGWRAPRTLARYLMDPPQEMQVDHVNGNTLDNRRENLRVCTPAQNCQARRPRKDANEWGYKGIIRQESRGYVDWLAYVAKRAVFSRTGRDPAAPHLAALHYNKAALAAYGEFAYLNDVPCFSEDPRPSGRCPTCHAACECCCVCASM